MKVEYAKEKHQLVPPIWGSYMPRLGICAWTGARACNPGVCLTGNQPHISVTGRHSKQLSHTYQGPFFYFIQPQNCCFPWVSQSTAMANRKCLLTRSLLNQMAMTSVHMVMTSKFLSPVPDQLFLSCRGVFPNMLGSSLKALWNELVLPSLIHSQISSSFQ